jgi:UDP:flavonoid glycosyltransferase YjiC (YdhE family)
LNDSWLRLDSTVRGTDAAFELPPEIANRPAESGLVYLSLGSLGSADVELMKRLVAVLGDTPHRYIVSKGPQHTEFELAPNMWGAEFLPQTNIVPLVDLVITHGGNNTTTESFHFGKPMIALPLFWDQYDNAQRVDETGFGVRLQTYAFEDGELRGAIDRLLASPVRKQLVAIGADIRSRDGVARAADAIERVGLDAR